LNHPENPYNSGWSAISKFRIVCFFFYNSKSSSDSLIIFQAYLLDQLWHQIIYTGVDFQILVFVFKTFIDSKKFRIPICFESGFPFCIPDLLVIFTIPEVKFPYLTEGIPGELPHFRSDLLKCFAYLHHCPD
jgi:hypothetical protein